MPDKLPTKLKKEPLIDAIFEIRFSSQTPASSILPGIFFNDLVDKKIEQLAAFQIPKQLRDADPNLKFAPLIRIHWQDSILLIGDSSVAVACKMPYPGWRIFRNAIKGVADKVISVGNMIESIQRYSLKYVDLLQLANTKDQIASLMLDLSLGGHKLENEAFQLRIDITNNDLIHIVQISSSVVASTLDGTTKNGLIIGIDTVRDVSNQTVTDFSSDLDKKIDDIHQKNKEMFFKCITLKTLAELEPVYDD